MRRTYLQKSLIKNIFALSETRFLISPNESIDFMNLQILNQGDAVNLDLFVRLIGETNNLIESLLVLPICSISHPYVDRKFNCSDLIRRGVDRKFNCSDLIRRGG